MPNAAAKSTGLTSKLIVSMDVFQALQRLARSRRLAATPSLMLDYTLSNNGIFIAGWIPSIDYQQVKSLYIPTQLFEQLKYVQQKINAKIYNFTLMDIVVANLVILRVIRQEGEMIGSVQDRGISSVIPGDIVQHYETQSNEIGWMSTAAKETAN